MVLLIDQYLFYLHRYFLEDYLQALPKQIYEVFSQNMEKFVKW